MQLATSGFRALKGGGQPHFLAGGGRPSRSIHIPAFARPPPNKPATTAQAVFRHARTAISRFVAHLTTPGTLRSSVHVPSGARAYHGPATRMPTINDRLSFPARQILSRPLAVPFLPRPPTVPRHITQVGLGTARNFSTGRPVFQHLVENVPVYARSFSEVDWDFRIKEERERLRLEKQKAKREAKAAKKAKVPFRPVQLNVVPTPAASTVESEKDELDHYFPAPAALEVTTYLLIPLAPTPTSRLPLPLNPPSTSAHPLLPFDVIASMHASHGTHALRVSTVFGRLDTAKVFEEPGVHCEARGDPSGLCTVLEVRFEGWTVNKVRGILGEAGTGWCVLEEVWRDQEHTEAEEMDAALEALSVSEADSLSRDLSLSGLSELNGSWGASDHGIDPSRSFVLPTLDFSASFPVPAWSAPAPRSPSVLSTPMSDFEFHNAWTTQMDDGTSSPGGSGFDGDSDVESAGSDWCDLSRAPSVTDVRFGFSSQFSEMMHGSEGPREELF
ncbi:hypothetical protein BD311DRAFT_765814 [Dichomitus squalens]|uniref:Uncharacterized protein n=1 Tax=Dichomitus squalens TaxID=114155 RepID=A0A4Q9MC36_9APHY|nr:hypothetical protein BD311DRAFT_765814 [Dichomitus squalens]